MRLHLLLERGSFWLLCLVAVLLPFEAHQTIGKIWGLTPLKLLFVLSMVLLVAAIIAMRQWPRGLPILTLPIAALCTAFLLAILTADEFRFNAAKSALRYLVGLLLFLAVFFLTRQDKAARRPQLAFSLCIGAVASSFIGFVILAGYPWAAGLARIFRPFEYYIYFTKRFSATLEYPNTAADYLVLTLPLTLMWAASLKSVYGKVLALIGLVFPLLLGLSFTYSRGGIAACAMACLVVAMCSWRSQPNRESWYLAGAVLMICAISIPLSTRHLLLRDANRSDTMQRAIGAAYELSETRIQRQPDQLYETDIQLINTGFLPWVNTPKEPLVLSFRWYDVNRRNSVWVEQIAAGLPSELASGNSIRLHAPYRTPNQEGYYYLIWEIFQYQDKMPWSTGRRISPGVTECFISREPLDLQSMPHVDPNQPRGGEEGAGGQGNEPSRLRLWQAALSIFQEHPLTGIGGGNFRLVYGRYLDLKRWDTRIQANSIVMEIAAGCGLLGLLALLYFFWSVARLLRKELFDPYTQRHGTARALQLGMVTALIGFGLHNLIDYFMEFTPTYFAFWIVLGLLASDSEASAGNV